MLTVEDLTKHFGAIRALEGVRFTVKRNTVAGVIGPNGSGKTTLLRGLAGLLPMDSGSIRWEGAPIPAGIRSTWIFYAEDATRPHALLRVAAIVRFYGSVFHRSRLFCDQIIDRLQLRNWLTARVSDLSKGTAKRLVIAIGLLSTQPVLMLDEPFDGLDLRQTLELIPMLREIAVQGRTLVLSIHQLRDAERACDSFLLLNNGQMTGSGTLSELREFAKCAPGSDLEAVFLALT
jgi:ABC-2 type transport system ATP-binding protein